MPDKAFRSRRTEFRAADPAEGQPMTLSGYFVVLGSPTTSTIGARKSLTGTPSTMPT